MQSNQSNQKLYLGNASPESNIILQPPLSRRGKGPGLLLITTHNHDDGKEKSSRKTLDPEPLQKWAEEGFVVAQVTISDYESDIVQKAAEGLLLKAFKALKTHESCTDPGKMGLIIYAADDSSQIGETLQLVNWPEITVVISYTNHLTTAISSSTPPLMIHCTGDTANNHRAQDIICVLDTKSSAFVLPCHNDYDSGNANVAHTRSLGFLKKHLGGPYFDLEAIWCEHTKYEFEERDVAKTMSTMVEEPYVNHVPTITGGIGRKALTDFYTNHFIFSNPADTKLELVSRTIGIDRVVDEFIFSFTHDRVIDWLLPLIPPTNLPARIPMTSIINLRGDKLYHEHISWDQATLLRQLGLLPEWLPFPYALPDGRTPAKGKRFEFRVPTWGVETAGMLSGEGGVGGGVRSNGLLEGVGVREVDDV